jgi:hypothetical protein
MENYQDSFAARQAEAQASLERAQKMQQYRQPQAPGMVGRVYVGTHPMQHLAELLRVHQGGKAEKEARSALGGISAERNKAVADALRGFSTNMAGAPEQRTPMQADAFDEADRASLGGNQNLTAVTPERKPDAMAAYQSLMNAPDAAMRTAGMTGFTQFQQKQAEQAQAQADRQRMTDLWKQSGGDPIKFAEMTGDPDLAKKYAELPTIGKPKVNMATDMLIPDPANPGGWIPNQALVDAKKGIARAGAVNVDARNFNTQESEQSKSYGKTLGDIRGKITQAGFDAPKQLAKLDRMETLLQGIDGGAAAPTLAQIASTANSFGIKLDKNLGPKEAAIALAVNMASGLREPGTGPMTDKDFDNFLKQVPDLSKSAEGRKAIMTTLRAATERDLQAAKFARDYAKQNKGVIDDNFFDAMAEFYAKTPVVNIPMPETNSRGSQFRVVR